MKTTRATLGPRSHNAPPPGANPRAGAAPPFFMTCERKMRVPRAGAAPPFVHHQTRRFRSGSRYRTYTCTYIAVDRITDIGSDRLTVLHVHSKSANFFVYLRS